MGNSILFNTAGSIALAINYEIQGPYNDKFLTKQGNTTVRIEAEFFVRVDDAVFCIETDVDVDEDDLDTGESYSASTTYYIYACHPLDATLTPVFKISENATYPSGGWTADNSRKIGGFETDGDGYVNESSIWDLRTVDVTCTGVEDADIPAAEISWSKLDSPLAIMGDATSGRKLRSFRVDINNGTNASTLKVKCWTTGYFNGDTIAEEDNLAKDGSTTSFSLSAAGGTLTIKATALSGNVVGVAGVIAHNSCGTAILVRSYVNGNNLDLAFTNATAGSGVDLTSLVDAGFIHVNVIYITAA